MTKTYVLDTNVLLGDPTALQSFEEHNVIIPLAVLEELDHHKNRHDDVGSCARQVNRSLDSMREKIGGGLFTGIKTHGGGTLRVVTIDETHTSLLPKELDSTKVDNKIIAFMKFLSTQIKDAILVSRDINVRIKCDALNIRAEDYKKIKIASTTQEFYKGITTIKLDNSELIDKFFENGGIGVDDLKGDEKLYPNQIIILNYDNGLRIQSGIGKVVVSDNGKWIKKIKDIGACYGLMPKNKEQEYALDLLLDPNINLVTLVGPAGCGKTLLALAAGLDQHTHLASEGSYQRLVISRPVMSVGKDLGFLPGTLKEKMDPWLAPIKDNLQFLLAKGKKTKRKSSQEFDPYLDLMLDKGTLEVEAISYIRGRSIPDSYIVIDEAQNLSIHELKTIITRVGENTKIVLTGDVEQIDNVNVDVFTNGLSYAIEKFKNSSLAGHVTLIKGERSILATEASKIL